MLIDYIKSLFDINAKNYLFLEVLSKNDFLKRAFEKKEQLVFE